MKRLPITGLTAAVDRMARSGDKRAAVRLAGTVRRQFPASPLTLRLSVRALLAPPLTRADVDEAADAAEIMLASRDDDESRATYVEVLVARHRIGDPPAPLLSAIDSFAATAPERRFEAARRFVAYLLAAGDSELALQAADAMARACPDDHRYTFLAHETALRCEHDGLVTLIEGRASSWSPEERARLIAYRLLRAHDGNTARRVLEGVRPSRPPAHSALYVSTLQRLGDPAGVLRYLDETDHGLKPEIVDEASFDALFSLGRYDEARMIADRTARAGRLPTTTRFLQMRDAYRHDGDLADEQVSSIVRRWEEVHPLRTPIVNDIMGFYFELDLLADVDRIAEGPRTRAVMGPAGQYTYAKSLYAQRRFSEALAVLEGLDGTGRHGEAAWLRSRIVFEQGDDVQALAMREAVAARTETMEEVSYFALLNQGRLADAFARYCPVADRHRLEAVVGRRAEFGPPLDGVARRMVLAQNGPGDEIQLASTYGVLRNATDQLVVIGDPRLTSLMARSFPDVHFRPTRRAATRRDPGFLAPGTPPRAANELYDLIAADDEAPLADSDKVILGRCLQTLALTREGREHYLVPDPMRTRPMAERAAAWRRKAQNVIGVCWRSELLAPLRNIHYLAVEELGPVIDVDATVVCLQHDVTEVERLALRRLAPGRAVFVDDLNLRDDFETTAALVAALDVVVGVGTSMVELAAAVGTPTVLIQPTRFGAWRAIDDEASDFWHASMRVAQVDRFDDRTEAVRRAAKYTVEALGERSARVR